MPASLGSWTLQSVSGRSKKSRAPHDGAELPFSRPEPSELAKPYPSQPQGSRPDQARPSDPPGEERRELKRTLPQACCHCRTRLHLLLVLFLLQGRFAPLSDGRPPRLRWRIDAPGRLSDERLSQHCSGSGSAFSLSVALKAVDLGMGCPGTDTCSAHRIA